MTDEEQWILPNFAMVNNQKTSTKVRIVFDPAAKLGLNDAIHSGPKLQRELVDVLTRFRREPVALSSNISQMFPASWARRERPPFSSIFCGEDWTRPKSPKSTSSRDYRSETQHRLSVLSTLCIPTPSLIKSFILRQPIL